jgi:hypothetical protein
MLKYLQLNTTHCDKIILLFDRYNCKQFFIFVARLCFY